MEMVFLSYVNELCIYTRLCLSWSLFCLRLRIDSSFSHVPILCDSMDCCTPGFPVHHQLPEFIQTHVRWVSDAIHYLILCHPLLLLPSFFPSMRVFSNESALCIRWPKYWSFSISPSNEHTGLISFRMDWLDLLACQGTLKSLLQHHSSKISILQPLILLSHKKEWYLAV